MKNSQNIWLLLLAALFAHLFLIWSGLNSATTPMGDLPFAYWPWLQNMLQSSKWLGINAPWVYPYPALAPMLLSLLVNPNDFQAGWLTVVTIMNLLIVGSLAGWGRRHEDSPIGFAAAWFWLLFLVALGPVSISRIDIFSVAIAIAGVLALVKRKLHVSTVWFSIGAWMKIWPMAFLVATFSSTKQRLRIVASVLASSVAVLAIGLLLGGNQNLFSFLSFQAQRGIQIEAPIASWWLWLHIFGDKNSALYYDQAMMTFQVQGAGVTEVAGLMTYAMFAALGITAYLAWQAQRSGAHFRDIVPIATLTAVLDLIVFNKVGSPQFIGWLAVPVILGLLYKDANWRIPIYAVVAIAALTGVIYPVVYNEILDGSVWATAILLLRNLCLVALLVFANTDLIKRQRSQESSTVG